MAEKKNRLVVANRGWAETIPEWLKDQTRLERLGSGLASVLGRPEEKVGYAELCPYLCTASLTAPMPHNWNGIYQFVTAKLLRRNGQEVPEFLKEKLEKGLSPDEAREMENIKRELYRKRGGEISHPLIDALKEVKRAAANSERKKAA